MAKGDHLEVWRGTYWHHGIDLGGDQVIQYGYGFAGETNACVEIVARNEFAQQQAVRVVDSPACYAPDEIIRRALTRLGEKNYSVVNNNCEHFVNWCRSGRNESRQIERLLQRATSVATKLMVHTVATGISKVAARSAVRAAAKSVAHVAGPTSVVADIAQLGAEATATNLGASPPKAEATGRVAGCSTSIGVGALMAGPMGALVGYGLWAAGEATGKWLTTRNDTTS